MVMYDHVWSLVIYDPLWLFMAMHSHVVSYMVIYGPVWPCVVMWGHVWSCMVIYVHVWSCMVINGHLLKGIESRSSVNSYEFVCLTQLCTIRACFINIHI